jgi:hypothetical protein
MQKPVKQHPTFRSPPLWMHVSEAGKWLLAPREAKKRAVIRMIDRLPTPGRKKPSQ